MKIDLKKDPHSIYLHCDVEDCSSIAVFNIDTLEEARERAATIDWTYDEQEDKDQCQNH